MERMKRKLHGAKYLATLDCQKIKQHFKTAYKNKEIKAELYT